MTEIQAEPGDTAAPLDQRIVLAAGQLTTILARETTLLAGMNAGALNALLPEKRAATQDYRMLLGRLAEQPERVGDLDAGRKAALRAAAEALAIATEANARALKASIEANQGLVRAIARAARDKHHSGDFYQANGRLSPGATAGKAPAVSYNQVL